MHIDERNLTQQHRKYETLADHAHEANITYAQRPSLIKNALLHEFKCVARTTKHQSKHAIESVLLKLATKSSHKLAKIAERLAKKSEQFSQNNAAKFKSYP